MSWTTDILALPSLLAYWPMRETSGTTFDNAEGTAAKDATISGTGYTLGVTGPILSEGAASKGVLWSAAGSTGANVADHASWDIGTADYTVGAWMKLTAAWPAASMWMLARGAPESGGGFEMYLGASDPNRFNQRLNGLTVPSNNTTTIQNSGWRFLVCAMDRDGNGQWYLDGAAYGTATSISAQSGTSITGSSSLYLGRRSAGGYFDGYQAETFIAGSLLSAATIAALYSTALGVGQPSMGSAGFFG